MSEPDTRAWDDSYQPTDAELDEPVQLEGAHDRDIDGAVSRLLDYTPPSEQHATS